jgi:hypothetical protein
MYIDKLHTINVTKAVTIPDQNFLFVSLSKNPSLNTKEYMYGYVLGPC